MPDSEPGQVNPYESPRSEPVSHLVSSRVSFCKASATFVVGEREKHAVAVHISLWSGEEVYTVDDVEVLRRREVVSWGGRRFTVGQNERHEVEIRAAAFPLSRCRALVDGRVYIPGLFSPLHLLFETLVVIVGAGAVGALIALCIQWACRR
jgi:hypothetical protein